MRCTAHISLLLVLGAAAPLVAQDLTTSIGADLAQLKAKSSFYAKHLPSGKTVEVRADQPMNTLSVIKIPVMIQAFRDVEAGRLDLNERYTIKPEDQRGGACRHRRRERIAAAQAGTGVAVLTDRVKAHPR